MTQAFEKLGQYLIMIKIYMYTKTPNSPNINENSSLNKQKYVFTKKRHTGMFTQLCLK